ncbi:EF-hand calcium-binding domain protein [Aspergillus terreus]|uniref:EF-hand calcium-binding domain protein n=1 Tax=Aspergillus terreus TaxID=33178 RepID=A0A5M3Z088_ASPTE|nr:hypothetical protein ATETN484_0006035700 [Aspergillus terreus]GFF12052.1 EF-hand calcium-binding domain protein [Aspergillus terreus]
MKILCLHGKGTSGEIFRSQTCQSLHYHHHHPLTNPNTASFRSRLTDLNLTFDFLDGEYPCAPAPGVDLFYPPPYYSHIETETLESTQAAVARVRRHLATHGPYDALMMFSQGCAVGASLLLLLQHDGLPPPVRAGIFICGGPPLTVLEHVGYDVPESVWAADRTSRLKLSQQADSAAILAKGSARWMAGSNVVDEGEVRARLSGGPVRIEIPTVHVYGNKDPRYEAGVLLSGVCEEGCRRGYDHGGGHEIPRTGVVSDTIAEMVRWVLMEGSM